MPGIEQISVEAIHKAMKQYATEMNLSLEQLHLVKNKSIEQLDEILHNVTKYGDSYIGGDVAKVKRLKKLIDKYKLAISELYISLRKDLELRDGKMSRSIQQYSQCLYYLNTVAFHDAPSLFEDPLVFQPDNRVKGVLQTVFDTECYVFGADDNIEQRFTGHQGNNNFGMESNCGLASVAQIAILSGKKVTENDVVRLAISEGLCEMTHADMYNNGGTSAYHRAALLEKLHIKSRIEAPTLEELVTYIEHGHGVIAAVDAGVFWNQPAHAGIGHAVVPYGTVRCAKDGTVMGFVICDTGVNQMKRFVTWSAFAKAYTPQRGINVTLEAIR